MKSSIFSKACCFVLLAVFGTASAEEHPSTAQANVHVLAPLRMPGLDRERTLRIYLPPGYEQSERRYPVLYMHDGQNLFDAATAPYGEWGVDEILNELARTKQFELIVVGIDHGQEKRMQELNAWENEKYGKGDGREYMRFVVDVVKPYVDTHYRTQPDRGHTAIMGSSMGGLISHYAIFEYPDVFGMAGIFSPSYWFAPAATEFTRTHALPRDARLYFYVGGAEGDTMLPDMRAIVAIMKARGFPQRNLRVEVNARAKHNEKAWNAEFSRAIEWLFDGVH